VSATERHDLAERAGVDPGFVDRLVELGILPSTEGGPYSDGDVRRVRIVQMLERAGIALEGIGRAISIGAMSLDFVETVTYERFASFGDVTFAELSEKTGIPVGLLMVVREATGSAQPAPGDRVRDDELDVVPLIEFQLAQGFRPAIIERALRVQGESLRRVAETESQSWHSELVVPRLRAGKGWAEIAALAQEVSPGLSETSDRALLAIYHAQQTHSWMKNILEGVESVLEGLGVHRRSDRSSPAICFLDVTGYTRLTEERGDEAAAEVAERLGRIVQRSSVQHGGRPVKWLGDGVMFYFPRPGNGVVAALDMVEAGEQAGLPPAHVGLHAGEVLAQEGDYFGRTVNVASRIADYARPGEVLVSQEVVDASADGGVVRFAEIGPVELKGVSGAITLHAAHRGQGPHTSMNKGPS
jgi:adenylate cyclase